MSYGGANRSANVLERYGFDETYTPGFHIRHALQTVHNLDAREQNKADLQEKCGDLTLRIDDLVADQVPSFNQTLQAYGELSQQISHSQNEAKNIQDNLKKSKQIMFYRRENLQGLYSSAMEAKEVLRLVTAIDQMKRTPDTVTSYMNRKHYWHATKALDNALRLLEGDLDGVAGLGDLRRQLSQWYHNLHYTLIDELQRHLYLKHKAPQVDNATEAIGKALQGFPVTREEKEDNRNLPGMGGKQTMLMLSASDISRSQVLSQRKSVARRANINARASRVSFGTMQGQLSDRAMILEVAENGSYQERFASGAEENPDYFILMMVESLAILGKLPDAIASIRSQMRTELAALIHTATNDMRRRSRVYMRGKKGAPLSVDVNYETVRDGTAHLASIHTNQYPKHDAALLLELLHEIFERFKTVISYHEFVLQLFSIKLEKKHRSNTNLSSLDEPDLYSVRDVWNAIQLETITLLRDYLGIHGTGNTLFVSGTTEEVLLDDAAKAFSETGRRMFGKADHINSRHLFRFANSEFAAGISSTASQQNLAGPRYNTLVTPCPGFIKVIFQPVFEFAQGFETMMSAGDSDKDGAGDVQKFLRSFIRDTYLHQTKTIVMGDLNKITISADALAVVKKSTDYDVDDIQARIRARHIFESAAAVRKIVDLTSDLLIDLPVYTDEVMHIISDAAQFYTEFLNSTLHHSTRYWKAIDDIGVETEESTSVPIHSVRFANDDNIKSIYYNMYSWMEAIEGNEDGQERDDEEEQSMVMEEVDYLIKRLAGVDVKVTYDSGAVKIMCNVFETSKWLADQMDTVVLDKVDMGVFHAQVPLYRRESLQLIEKAEAEGKTGVEDVIKNLKELSQTALATMRLELLCHCVQRVGPLLDKRNLVCEQDQIQPQPVVLLLCKDFWIFEEALSTSADEAVFAFVLESSAQLLTQMLLSAGRKIEKANIHGIQRMLRNIWTLQQNLNDIKGSHVEDMDTASVFFSTIIRPFEETLDEVMHEGLQMSMRDYEAAFSVGVKNKLVETDLSVKDMVSKLSEQNVPERKDKGADDLAESVPELAINVPSGYQTQEDNEEDDEEEEVYV
eukprot:Clim_evm110s157 gene=Clim_evmTU110s157